MTDKNEPRIRIVTLKDDLLLNKANNKTASCKCDGDCPPFGCTPQIIPCDCNPQCNCDSHKKKQQQYMKGKEKHRTFFKIRENKISD